MPLVLIFLTLLLSFTHFRLIDVRVLDRKLGTYLCHYSVACPTVVQKHGILSV